MRRVGVSILRGPLASAVRGPSPSSAASRRGYQAGWEGKSAKRRHSTLTCSPPGAPPVPSPRLPLAQQTACLGPPFSLQVGEKGSSPGTPTGGGSEVLVSTNSVYLSRKNPVLLLCSPDSNHCPPGSSDTKHVCSASRDPALTLTSSTWRQR